MEFISVIISVTTLLFSIATYVVHDRKLKKQERLLNEYQLRSLALCEAENKKAVIRAIVHNEGSGSRTLYIVNEGKSKAVNLRIELSDPKQITLIRPELPFVIDQLLPGAHREFTLFLCEGEDEATFVFRWEDDFSKGNEESQTIDL